MGGPRTPTGPDPQGARPTDADPSVGPAPTGQPSEPSPSRKGETPPLGGILGRRLAASGASSKWDELREAVGAEEEVVRDSLDADESVEGGEDADPELIAEAERIADEALAEARAAEEASGSPIDAEVDQAEQILLDDVGGLVAERDDYLEQLRRVTADFDNYRKRMLKQQSEHVARAAEALVEKLLDSLDTFDLALAHGEGFEQVQARLLGVLEKEGLQRIDPVGQAFDPNEADAVAHEDADDGPLVSEVLRPGYRWKGRVLRPAMVKVRG